MIFRTVDRPIRLTYFVTCTVAKVAFIGFLFLGSGVSSNELVASKESGSKYGEEIQTLGYRYLNRDTIIFFDYERTDSNILLLTSNDFQYLYTVNEGTIPNLFSTLFWFIHADEIAVNKEDITVAVTGYYMTDTNLKIPFIYFVTQNQSRLLCNRIMTEIAEDDAIINKPYKYTISPSIVLEVNLMPTFNVPRAGSMTLRYYKYVKLLDYVYMIYQYIIAIASLLIILGSLLICTSILKYKNLMTPPNIYVFNLAVSDMLLFSMRFIGWVFTKVGSNTNERWGFWHINLTISQICWNVVCWTAVGITIDRYIAICHPFLGRRISTKSRAVKINIAIWALSLIVTLMQDVYHQLYLNDKTISKLAYQASTRALIMLIIVPMCIILPAYICIIQNILKSSRLRKTYSINEQPLTNRSIKIAAVIAVQFCFCFAPTVGYTYVYKIFNPNLRPLGEKVIAFLVMGLSTIGSMLHPIMYALVSVYFRKAFKEIGLICFGCVRRLLCFGKCATHADQKLAQNEF